MPPLIRDLLWDSWNEDHIARHGVNKAEVHQVCFGDPWIGRTTGDGKRPVYGQTDGGRYLFVVLADRSMGQFYPVTARDMNATERRRYQQVRGR